jgi:hypothetical protein
LVVETLERNPEHARHKLAIGRVEAVPTNGPGDMAESMVLHYRLPCPRTFDQALACAAIRSFGNMPMRVRLMGAYEPWRRLREPRRRTMKLRRPTVTRQIISVTFEGEKREFVIADWPDGERLPAQVVAMIMDTWTSDGSWVHKDGSILYVQERRQRGRTFKVERYPLIVVDESNEVLYGVEALEAAKRAGAEAVMSTRIHAEDHGFPPPGARHPVAP